MLSAHFCSTRNLHLSWTTLAPLLKESRPCLQQKHLQIKNCKINRSTVRIKMRKVSAKMTNCSQTQQRIWGNLTYANGFMSTHSTPWVFSYTRRHIWEFAELILTWLTLRIVNDIYLTIAYKKITNLSLAVTISSTIWSEQILTSMATWLGKISFCLKLIIL